MYTGTGTGKKRFNFGYNVMAKLTERRVEPLTKSEHSPVNFILLTMHIVVILF